MNIALEQAIHQADGRYFTDVELGLLEDYLKTFPGRLETYSILCEKSDEFINKALQKLAHTDAHVVREHGEKCVRDMSYVLRYVAIAVLRDDDSGFKQQLILWMQNIMAALNKEAQSARAYRLLQEVLRENMSAENARLVNDSLDEFIAALMVRV